MCDNRKVLAFSWAAVETLEVEGLPYPLRPLLELLLTRSWALPPQVLPSCPCAWQDTQTQRRAQPTLP